MHPRRTLLAALLPSLFATSAAMAQEQLALLDSVIVSANRFVESDARVPATVSVISREDIEHSPARNLPDLLKNSAGLNVVPLYGNMGIDATVDIRGFGDSANSNTLVLLDGQRLNPIDMGSISWSLIPLEQIQRVEIIRGSGTVLYGDRATGGIINIITDKSGKEHAFLAASVGSNDFRGVDGLISGGNTAGYYNFRAHYAATDGWRQNTQAEQQVVSGRGGWYLGRGEVFTDFAVYKDDSGMPGSIAEAVYRSNPRQARTPLDSQRKEGYRLRPGVSIPIGDTLNVEAEISVEHEQQHFNNVSFGSTFNRERNIVSFTPRLRWNHGLAGLRSETVVGLDYYAGKVDNEYSSYPTQNAKQFSSAGYFQNTTQFGQSWTATIGGRNQRMDQRARQDAYPAFFMPAMSGGTARTRNAWDAGLTYSGEGWRAYGKFGTAFRFANTDELFGFDPFNGNPVFAGDLKPQRGTLKELGASFKSGPVSGRAAIYDMQLTNEIGYDGSLFANVNFDPTRRQGLETEAEWQIDTRLRAGVSYTYSDATFRDGIYDGKRIPLSPRNKAALNLNWDTGSLGNYTVVTNYVGERIYSGDFANVRKHLANYTTVDLMGSWNFRPWTLTARLLNVFDKRYAPFALYATSRSDYYYYPADGRSFYLTAKYDFK